MADSPARPSPGRPSPGRPSPAPGGDLAEVVARFGAGLRRAGLPVGPGRCERFPTAVILARPRTPDALYLCALATLVSGRDQIDITRGAFDQVFAGRDAG